MAAVKAQSSASVKELREMRRLLAAVREDPNPKTMADVLARRPWLKRGIAATRDGKSYLVEVATARVGGGAESTWYEKFNLAEKRKRRV